MTEIKEKNVEKTEEQLKTEIRLRKVQDLETTHECKIIQLVFIDEETKEEVIGYMKKPNTLTKLRAMDQAVNGLFTASEKVLKASLIKEESDKRLWDEKEIEKEDSFYLGAVNSVLNSIKIAQNQLKKN